MAGGQVVHRLVGQAGHLHIEQGHVDVLALAGLLAGVQRGQHADRGVQPGENVGEGDAGLHGAGAILAIGLAGQAHQPAEPLDHEVITCSLGVGPVLPEAGDGAVDQSRVDRFQRLVVEAISRQATDLEVFQNHVALGRQFTDQTLALGLGKVEGQ